jgi:hypothetical protein
VCVCGGGGGGGGEGKMKLVYNTSKTSRQDNLSRRRVIITCTKQLTNIEECTKGY